MMIPYLTLPYSTLVYSTLLYFTLLYFTLLYLTLLYLTLLYSTLLYLTLFHSTLPYSTLPYYTALHSTRLFNLLDFFLISYSLSKSENDFHSSISNKGEASFPSNFLYYLNLIFFFLPLYFSSPKGGYGSGPRTSPATQTGSTLLPFPSLPLLFVVCDLFSLFSFPLLNFN